MDDVFDLPVSYQGKDLHFPAQLLQTGYTHRFLIEVYGAEVIFEPDEERSYRALVDAEKVTKHMPADLLEAIARSIEEVLR